MRASDTREQILDAARGLVVREGFANASMHAIARAAGITRSMVYAEFGDREQLLAALVDREEERVLTMAVASIPEISPGVEPLTVVEQAADIYFELVRTAPETWQFVLAPPAGVPSTVRERVDRGREQIRQRSEAMIAIFAAFNDRIVDAEMLSHAIVSASETAARLMVTAQDAAERDAIAATSRWAARKVVSAVLAKGD